MTYRTFSAVLFPARKNSDYRAHAGDSNHSKGFQGRKTKRLWDCLQWMPVPIKKKQAFSGVFPNFVENNGCIHGTFLYQQYHALPGFKRRRLPCENCRIILDMNYITYCGECDQRNQTIHWDSWTCIYITISKTHPPQRQTSGIKSAWSLRFG